MRIPEEITKEHIKQAIALIDNEQSIPRHRASTGYDLRFNGKKYPPKYVLSRAYRLIHSDAMRLRNLRGGHRTNSILASLGFDDIVPKGQAEPKTPKDERKFWVLSPNVTDNSKTIDLWKQAVKKHEAAFMGWGPKDPKHRLGRTFAEDISKGDVILIGRRSQGVPDIVGFGVVSGKYRMRLKGLAVPDKKWHGSIRKLSPFVPVSAISNAVPIIAALNHTQALCQLYPHSKPDHRMICVWMSKRLGLSIGNNRHRGAVSKSEASKQAVRRKPHTDPAQFDFTQRSAEAVRIARKREDALVREYKKWLKNKGHEIDRLAYDRFQCDAHEEDRNNLIEAKSSNKREYIRMAVGQLLDYAFLGKQILGTPHMAILLPRKPDAALLEWLAGLKISVIWKQRKVFVDSADGQFI